MRSTQGPTLQTASLPQLQKATNGCRLQAKHSTCHVSRLVDSL